ncbi:MAG TPA: SDR family oxidoreductase, partial [Longimicrobium sp.]|nr:SDR family oxidoreductase [Longimicrobium sp.]
PEAGDGERAALLRAAGQLWCAGVEIDWDALHPAGSARRVPLPTYPFERLPFIVKADRMVAEAPAAPEVRRNTDAAQWFFVPSWKRSAPLLEEEETARPGTGWLLFVDEGGLGEALADRLRAAGERVATVHAGSAFEQGGLETFTIAPDQRRDYEALLARLISSGMRPARIVHLWCANDAAPEDATPAQRFEAAQRRGFDALLLLLQALGTVGHDTLHLDVVTNGAFEVTGGEPLHPEWAAALGPLRVVPQEYPNVRCRGIDVVFTGRSSRDRLARQLAGELRGGSGDRSVAYRGSHRWIQQFEPLPLSPPRTTDAGFRQDGVYLITGGMGRLGLIVAEHIASRVGARLVLTGRGELPPEAEWESWLEVHHAGDRVGQRIRKLMRLREMGAEVMCVAADVSREEHMRAVVEQAEARWGRIDGVVHAAAITDRGAYREIRATDPAETPPLFRAKVHALHVLERVLEDRELDFVMLFSSLSAIVGGLGFAAYSAANLYMDTFAQQHNRGGRAQWTSVNWDGWVESAGPRQGPGAALAALSLRPEEGADAFQRIVASGVCTQLAVSTTDVQARIDEWTIPEDREHAAAEADLLLPQGGPADGPSASPMTDIEDAVISVWKALLGVDEIGRDDDFLELGGNSLLGIRVLGQLRKRFQVDLPADTIFRASTVSQLADRIMSLLLAEIEMSADAV